MTLIRVKDGTVNETAQRNKMHKSRRKIIDVMRGVDTKDTFGWTPEAKDVAERNAEEQRLKEEKSKIFDDIRMPTFCPKCENFMKHKLDKKFYYRTGHCFDCQVELEHELRVKGVYPTWEKMKVFQNEISILKDAHQQFTEAYESLQPHSELITSEGKIIKFEHLGSWEEVKADIKEKIDDIESLLPVAETELLKIQTELEDADVEIPS